MFFMKPKGIQANRLRAAKQLLRALLAVNLAVFLLICTVGAYKVHADVDEGRNTYFTWYMSVYDVGRFVGNLETLSRHYYWVQSLSSRNVFGRWEFAHRIRKGWGLGQGDEMLNISIDGNINTLYQAHDGTSDSDTRIGSYAGYPEGKYHIEAYTNLSLNVVGVTASNINPKPSKAVEYDTFKLTGEEVPN